MLQNARVTAFTVSELLRENEQGVKLPPTHTPRLGLNMLACNKSSVYKFSFFFTQLVCSATNIPA